MTISVWAALALTAVWLPLIALAINALAERSAPRESQSIICRGDRSSASKIAGRDVP
ncbi:hypothetical protein ABIF90_004756 [Bradyrhizobium japonicum]